MKRELLAITDDLVRESATAAGWERVGGRYDERLGNLIRWRRGDVVIETNDPEGFPEPMRQAIRARVLAGLTLECPRCGVSAVGRDPERLSDTEMDRAQVIVGGVNLPLVVTIDGQPAGVAVKRLDDTGFMLLHDVDCEATPVNLDELGRARWN